MAKFVDNEERRAALEAVRPDATRAMVRRQQMANAIRAIMKQRRLTQTKVAAFVGVSDMAVSYWCRGKDAPVGANLDRLAAALGVAPEFLTKPDHEGIAQLTRASAPGVFLDADADAQLRNHETAGDRRRQAVVARKAERKREQAERDDKAAAVRRNAQRAAGGPRSLIERLLEREADNMAPYNCPRCYKPVWHVGLCHVCVGMAGGGR